MFGNHVRNPRRGRVSRTWQWYIHIRVSRWVRKPRDIYILSVVAIWMLTSGIACVLPEGQLAAEHSECCREMNGECHSMPFSESCCTIQTQQDHVTTAAQQQSFKPNIIATPLILGEQPARLCFGETSVTVLHIHSPPKLTAISPTILRI